MRVGVLRSLASALRSKHDYYAACAFHLVCCDRSDLMVEAATLHPGVAQGNETPRNVEQIVAQLLANPDNTTMMLLWFGKDRRAHSYVQQ
jgi:hypothetical protein